MRNYVTRVLIGKSSGANTGNTLQTIAPGDILFVNGDNGQVLADAASIAAVSDNTPIYAAMGVGQVGQVRLTSPIRRKELEKFTREAYRNKQEQVDVVTPVLVAGRHYRFSLVLKDQFRWIDNRQTKLEIPGIIATGNTAADLALVARRINKYKATQGMLLATSDATTLTVRGQAIATESVLDQYSYVAFDTVFVETDTPGLYPSVSSGTLQPVVTTQVASPGSGIATQVMELELLASGYLGNTDLVNFDRKPAVSRVDPNGNYDIIHVRTQDKHQGDHEFTMESPVQATFCTVSGSPVGTFVETMLKAFLHKDPAANATSLPDPDQVGGE
jgi:hypothetical protein